MQLIRQLEPFPQELRGGATSIGNFDGVHRGHAKIIADLRAAAEKCGGPAVVFTFEPHPALLLRPDAAPPPLTWLERKVELLESLGVDAVVAYPTDRQLLSLTPSEFFTQVVIRSLDCRQLVEGPNFFFGHDRAGTIATLRELCDAHQIGLQIVAPVEFEGAIVSSSRIRQAVREGRMDEADRWLGRPYRIQGTVVRGAGRGAGIGFATANLERIETLAPAHGVYAARARCGPHDWTSAAVHIGPSPTFGQRDCRIETHLIGVDGELYGETLVVDFLERLRDIHKFSSVEALRGQLAQDVAAARKVGMQRSRAASKD